jgi:hypothetical protein
MKTYIDFHKEINKVLMGEADFNDYQEKEDDKEATDIKPRSKGEEKFKKISTTKKIGKHPVAKDKQFSGGSKKGDKHKGYSSKHSGEMKPVMQGTSKIKEENLDELSKGALSSYINKANTDRDKSKEEVIDEGFTIENLKQWAKTKNKSYDIRFDNGDHEKIDSNMSQTMMEVYNKLNSSNKKSFEKNMNKSMTSFMKLASIGG